MEAGSQINGASRCAKRRAFFVWFDIAVDSLIVVLFITYLRLDESDPSDVALVHDGYFVRRFVFEHVKVVIDVI